MPFVHEIARYLASGRGHTIDYLVAEAPPGVKRAPGIAAIADAARGSAGTRTIAVNVDPRESDPARLSVDDFQSAVARLKDAGTLETRGEATAPRQDDDTCKSGYVYSSGRGCVPADSL